MDRIGLEYLKKGYAGALLTDKDGGFALMNKEMIIRAMEDLVDSPKNGHYKEVYRHESMEQQVLYVTGFNAAGKTTLGEYIAATHKE